MINILLTIIGFIGFIFMCCETSNIFQQIAIGLIGLSLFSGSILIFLWRNK